MNIRARSEDDHFQRDRKFYKIRAGESIFNTSMNKYCMIDHKGKCQQASGQFQSESALTALRSLGRRQGTLYSPGRALGRKAKRQGARRVFPVRMEPFGKNAVQGKKDLPRAAGTCKENNRRAILRGMWRGSSVGESMRLISAVSGVQFPPSLPQYRITKPHKAPKALWGFSFSRGHAFMR